MNPLEIGVLTLHKSFNYGSYWQAMHLVRFLSAQGASVRLLDHQSRRVLFAEIKCGLQPVLPTPVPLSDRPLYRKRLNAFFEAFEQMPCTMPFPLEEPGQMPASDLVVVGSDEVWNLFHPWYGGASLFWGDGVNTQMLVSYAASFGSYSAQQGLGPEWAERLRQFDLLAVRDNNSFQLVQGATGIEPELVVDPCLLTEEAGAPDMNQPVPERYLAVYGHNFEPHFIAHAKEFARRSGLPLVSIGYRNDWADLHWIEAGPLEFDGFMRNSAAVITNFFHGCVFALRYHRPFACAATPYRSIKVISLMEKLGGLNHLVHEGSPYSSFEDALTQPLAPYLVHRIGQLRQSSQAYLQRALQLKQYQYA